MSDEMWNCLQEAADTLIVFIQGMFAGLVFVLLFATLPVWIIPYWIWKNRKEKNHNEQ